jgi:hypothetical protein
VGLTGRLRAGALTIGFSILLFAAFAWGHHQVGRAIEIQAKHVPDPEAVIVVGNRSMSADDFLRYELVPRLEARGEVGWLKKRVLLLQRSTLWTASFVALAMMGWCASVWLTAALRREMPSALPSVCLLLLASVAGLLSYLLLKLSFPLLGRDLFTVCDRYSLLPFVAGIFPVPFYRGLEGVLQSVMKVLPKAARTDPERLIVPADPISTPSSGDQEPRDEPGGQQSAPSKDFFISYNKSDKEWAEWIAWTLEEAGFEVVFQGWDFRPGENFVLRMQQAAVMARRTVVVLSPAYLAAQYTQPEWAAAFLRDPQGRQRTLIPIRVRACAPEGLLRPLIYADLVGLSREAAKQVLLQAIEDRAKPRQAPEYPADGAPKAPSVPFPAPRPIDAGAALAVWQEKLAFLLEQEPLVTDVAQRFTLRKQIEEARKKVGELGGHEDSP